MVRNVSYQVLVSMIAMYFCKSSSYQLYYLLLLIFCRVYCLGLVGEVLVIVEEDIHTANAVPLPMILTLPELTTSLSIDALVIALSLIWLLLSQRFLEDLLMEPGNVHCWDNGNCNVIAHSTGTMESSAKELNWNNCYHIWYFGTALFNGIILVTATGLNVNHGNMYIFLE